MNCSRGISEFLAMVLLLGLWVSEVCSAKKSKGKEDAYFKGKAITFIVPVSPGGGF